ncbi:PLP-dependent aminotransferase family protein [Chryseobacterium sp. JUb7]|uniref:aminotransferase-like domain-containing protein n=1 Tax=Chryseobacterium sp. JUb7 TaxID=2940599 RepID=UPI00216763B7|nr:PLP-dependent aminotransferase family protein [Chryseobacterium sp. JUb7]MCS3529025.1 DNA-binding transcriptional MocR family regulator [Chryseobacterium sp. JUb7]
MNKEFLYTEIASGIATQIRKGVLKPGDKLPSVRMLCQDHHISMNTAKRVFLELESQSLVDSKPQSGYFVSPLTVIDLPLAEISSPSLIANNKEPDELISKVYENIGNKNMTIFSIGIPSGDLLPQAKLKKEIINATRELKEGGTEYEELQGNLKLRRMIALRSMSWGGNFNENDLVTTNGGMNALSFCLMALGKPGDTIAIESPCYPGILQLANGLGLKVLELPTHPTTGIEIEALKKVIPKIDICLLIPNFNSPLGSCMPDDNKKEIVKLLSENGIPLIEDDVYGDLYFGSNRPKCCKSFDMEGNVLYCSSISKTLAPGYRVGWIAPGKYKDKILKLKLLHSTSSITVVNEAVANFLKTGRYEKHLQQLRKTLQNNCQSYIQTIAEYFPEGTKISRPQGGLSLWVEFDKHLKTTSLYDLAIKQNISIAPGRMFTLQDQFENCMRLCIGLPWTESTELSLRKIGELAKSII